MQLKIGMTRSISLLLTYTKSEPSRSFFLSHLWYEMVKLEQGDLALGVNVSPKEKNSMVIFE